MVRDKTNLVNEYNVYYCYERGCTENDQFMCMAFGPCSVFGGECPQKTPLIRLCDFGEGMPESKPIIKKKNKNWLCKKICG